MRAIAADEAARALVGLDRLDPTGMAGPDDVGPLCAAGRCFALSGAAQAVYVLTVRNGVVWVDGLKGASGQVDVFEALDAIVTEQAQGARSIALQTKRRGLVAALKPRGYRVSGWILTKELQ